MTLTQATIQLLAATAALLTFGTILTARNRGDSHADKDRKPRPPRETKFSAPRDEDIMLGGM